MTKKLRVAIAQLNFKVGDLKHNLEKHQQAAIKARDELKADIIVFPELSLTGYPPEDLLLRPSFLEETDAALKQLTRSAEGIHCVVSHPLKHANSLFNACSVIYNGAILGQYSKQHLPNYGVFDECRYFTPGSSPCVIPINGIPVGIVICEDLWQPGPTREAADHGARFILSPNASPFEVNKHEERIAILSKRAKTNQIPIFYVNSVGGQDEITFDGGSMVFDDKGNMQQCAGFFNETIMPVDIEVSTQEARIEQLNFIAPNFEERIYQSLVLGLRDYINKNNFPGVIIGLSGGIDSALTLALAVDALGSDKVHAVFMPSRYTAAISEEDAILTAKNLGVTCDTISIEPIYQSFLTSLAPALKNKKPDITEENIQSRSRAVILMALSNQSGHLVLTTGNRSELAVGYCTIYGDMAGGFAILKDIPKTLVNKLSVYRNQISPVIPERTITRPPSAELAPDQKDEDSLPPYPVLDAILAAYLDRSESVDDIIAQGFDAEQVKRVIGLVHRSEYKRKQAATGPRINHKSFGKDWRYPVTNGYKS